MGPMPIPLREYSFMCRPNEIPPLSLGGKISPFEFPLKQLGRLKIVANPKGENKRPSLKGASQQPFGTK